MTSVTTIVDDVTGAKYTLRVAPDADLGFSTYCDELHLSLGWYENHHKAKVGALLKLNRILNNGRKDEII